jgi:hypothetical protein
VTLPIGPVPATDEKSHVKQNIAIQQLFTALNLIFSNGVAVLPNDSQISGDLLATDIAAPATPASGFDRIWVDLTDKRLHDINDAGTIGTTVVADAGANQFLTAISAAGVISKIAASTPWTPALVFGGASVGMTASNSGASIRIGPFVIAVARINLSAKGSSTGAAAITGLPFAEGAGVGGVYVPQFYVNLAGLTGAIFGLIGAGNSVVGLQQHAAGTVIAVTDANFTNTSTLNGTCIYLAA